MIYKQDFEVLGKGSHTVSHTSASLVSDDHIRHFVKSCLDELYSLTHNLVACPHAEKSVGIFFGKGCVVEYFVIVGYHTVLVWIICYSVWWV